MKVLVQNWLAFKRKSDAIAHAVVKNIDLSSISIFDGDNESTIYPCDHLEQHEGIFEVLETYELDNIELFKIQVHDKYYWTSCAMEV